MNILKPAALCAMIMFTASCISTGNNGPAYIDVYDTDSYSPEQLATLFVPDNIYISELDGERMPSGYAYHGAAIRTLPGNHQAKINYGNPGELSQQGSLKFDLEQARSYFLQLRTTAPGAGTVIQFDIHECGGEQEQEAIRTRRKTGSGSSTAPCTR